MIMLPETPPTTKPTIAGVLTPISPLAGIVVSPAFRGVSEIMLAEVKVGLSRMPAGEVKVENVEIVEIVESEDDTVCDVSPVIDPVDELCSVTLIVEVIVLLPVAVVVIVCLVVVVLAFSCRCSEPQPERQASMSQHPLNSQPGDVHTYQLYPGRQSILLLIRVYRM